MKLITYIAFAFILLIGLGVYKDYGVAWDEPLQRDLGLTTHNYLKGSNTKLLNHSDKYYGQWFELLLVWLEPSNNTRDIYTRRHQVNFLFFFVGLIFFYKALVSIFESRSLALLGTLILFASPRIFAHSFFNSKDIVFMVTGVIFLYALVSFLNYQNFKSLLILSISTALAISTRITGVFFILPAFLAVLLARPLGLRKRMGMLMIYLASTLLITVLLWPILWVNPVDNLLSAFNEMSKYPQSTSTLLFGMDISSSDVPWYYVPAWIGITTPIMYLALFVVGLGAAFLKFQQLPFTKKTVLAISVLAFFAPIIIVILLDSTFYNGWRQMYFIYPFMLIIAMFTLDLIKSYSFNVKFISFGLVLLSVSIVLFNMYKTHPFQYIYFNLLAGNRSLTGQKFEVDYWGVSGKQALEQISNYDSRNKIKISGSHYSTKFNALLVDPNRFIFTENIGEANYYISHYPSVKQHHFRGYAPFSKLEVGGLTVAKIFKN